MFETNCYELSSDVLLCIHIQGPNAHVPSDKMCHFVPSLSSISFVLFSDFGIERKVIDHVLNRPR